MEKIDYNKIFYQTKSISGKKFKDSGSTSPEVQRDWLTRKHKFPEGVVDYVMQETYLLMSQGKREFIDGFDFDLYLELRCQEVMQDEINAIVKLRQDELSELIDLKESKIVQELEKELEMYSEEAIDLHKEIGLLNGENQRLNKDLNLKIEYYETLIENFKSYSFFKRIWYAIKRKIY